jgi:hypothetical protein
MTLFLAESNDLIPCCVFSEMLLVGMRSALPCRLANNTSDETKLPATSVQLKLSWPTCRQCMRSTMVLMDWRILGGESIMLHWSWQKVRKMWVFSYMYKCALIVAEGTENVGLVYMYKCALIVAEGTENVDLVLHVQICIDRGRRYGKCGSFPTCTKVHWSWQKVRKIGSFPTCTNVHWSWQTVRKMWVFSYMYKCALIVAEGMENVGLFLHVQMCIDHGRR